MEDKNMTEPTIIWTQYMDFLQTYGRQLQKSYAERMREDKPFSLAEVDAMIDDLESKLIQLRG